jgi:hypothetical protein
MAYRKNKPLVDLGSGGTLEDVVAAAQGRSLRVELETGMQLVREGRTNNLKTICTARLYTTRQNPSGSQSYVPLCMPMTGETWSEVLTALGAVLDQHEWTDIAVATTHV